MCEYVSLLANHPDLLGISEKEYAAIEELVCKVCGNKCN